MANVREQVATLSEFGDQVAAEFAAERDDEQALYRRIGAEESAPDRGVIVEALQQARRGNVTSEQHGPRVETQPSTGDYLRLVYQPEEDFREPELSFEIMRVTGWPRTSVPWDEDVGSVEIMLKVARVLQAKGIDGRFNVADWFRRLSETLVVGASHPKRRAIIELCPPQWAVTDSGVVPYPDHPLRGLGATSLRDPRSIAAVRAFPWVDVDSFDQAVYMWQQLFGANNPWGSATDSPPF